MDLIIWFLVDVLWWGVGAVNLKIISLGKLKISKIEPNWVAGFGAIPMISLLVLGVNFLKGGGMIIAGKLGNLVKKMGVRNFYNFLLNSKAFGWGALFHSEGAGRYDTVWAR